MKQVRHSSDPISSSSVQDLLNRVTPEIKAYKQLQEDHKKLEAVHAQAQKQVPLSAGSCVRLTAGNWRN
jgi:hypothetical protein